MFHDSSRVSQALTLSTAGPVYVLAISHELSKWRMLTGGSILASDWSEGSNAALSLASTPGVFIISLLSVYTAQQKMHAEIQSVFHVYNIDLKSWHVWNSAWW